MLQAAPLATGTSVKNVYLYFFTHQPVMSLNMDDLQYFGAFHGAEGETIFDLDWHFIFFISFLTNQQ